MAQGIRVTRRGATKITTLRLATSELARAERLRRNVARALGLQKATVSDVLREAVALGLSVLNADAETPLAPHAAVEQWWEQAGPMLHELIGRKRKGTP